MNSIKSLIELISANLIGGNSPESIIYVVYFPKSEDKLKYVNSLISEYRDYKSGITNSVNISLNEVRLRDLSFELISKEVKSIESGKMVKTYGIRIIPYYK